MSYPADSRIFCNRTLNLRSVQAIGYDMDYTLVHYRVAEWEATAYRHARARLAGEGWPVETLQFDPTRYTVGLVFDLELGNLVKATRFGYVVKAMHGNELLSFEDQRRAYAGTVVSLSSPRFRFMNTLFELSSAALWCGMVEQYDQGQLSGVSSYADLYRLVDDAISGVHFDGTLKAETLADPVRFVEPDPDVVTTLQDQRLAGKQLMLITNSDWAYTKAIMARAVDPYCPPGTNWRDLFDFVIVSAGKPRFFTSLDPVYRVVDEDRSLLQPHYSTLEPGHVYFGGNARIVEQTLGLAANQLLYVGDHLFGDVHVSKDLLRWRTALVAREIEAEVADAAAFEPKQRQLVELMKEKTALEHRLATARLERARDAEAPGVDARLSEIGAQLSELDGQIAPLAAEASQLGNAVWGPLMRAGNDKSLYARQVERYADVYLSRVANFLPVTPFAYLRAARGTLPHDPDLTVDSQADGFTNG